MLRAVAPLLVCVLLTGCFGGGSSDAPKAAPAGAAARPATAPYWPDRARYTLDVRYRPYAISGSERISFVNTGPSTLRSIWLRTWANAYGSCAKPYATVKVTGGGTAGAQRRGCTAQAVALAKPLAPGARTEIALDIRVEVPSRPDRFGRMGRIAVFGNGIPILAVADRGGWHLPPYTDRGESFFSLASSWDVTVHAPPGVQLASTGTERSHTGDATVLRAPRARDFTLVAGPMDVATTHAGPIRIRRFTHHGAPKRQVRAALRAARESVLAYQKRFGPYGAPELDVVEGPSEVANGGLAMEYPELVLTPYYRFALVHEVAHQWWFGIVGDDEWGEPWLDEAMAEYSAASLPDRIGGPDRLGLCPHLPRRRPPLTSSMARFAHAPPRLYSRSIYVAGACSLKQLERGIGRRRMDRFLRGLVRAHRYGVLTTAGFVRALRAAAPKGFDVDAWLRSARIHTRA
jgi:hypothetical protein